MELYPPGTAHSPSMAMPPLAPKGEPPGQDMAAPAPSDSFTPGTAAVMRDAASAASGLFGATAKEYEKALENDRKFTSTPVLFGNSAGWKAPLLEEGERGEYEKIICAGGDKVLILPLRNNCGTLKGTAVFVSPEKGVIEKPDVNKIGQQYAQRITASFDGSRTYITDGLSSHVKSFDESLDFVADMDLASYHADFGRVNDFRCGVKANYAFVLSPQNASDDKDYLVALEPSTNRPLWHRELPHLQKHGVFEGPDGSVYAVTDDHGAFALHKFSRDGKEKGVMAMEGRPRDIVFQKDATMVMNIEGGGVRALTPSSRKPGNYTQKWAITSKEYYGFQPSRDGSSLYGIDNGWSRNRLAKIDAETGSVLWEKDAKDSHLLDFRVINDEIYTLSQGHDHKTVFMRKFGADGKTLWEDSAPLGELGQWHGPAITPKGGFIFAGDRDGSLYFMHPRRDGETRESIAAELSNPHEAEYFRERVLEMAEAGPVEKPDEKKIVEEDQFLIIGGLKIKKKDTR
ncbi:MAG: PQQ-binding-like beta-propeller repeat protein [Candidatus Eremiobacteraeota bacterium]|nr:PQQ-binding-like beta-propeller repeat protein [Candidatus Eremiobacteraeota bacterium]